MIESTIRTKQPKYWGTPIEDPPGWDATAPQGNHPSLEEVLASQDQLPAASLLLGLGADGLPLVLDLEDPGCGAFLIASDDGFDNTTLLHSLITAALKGNHPEDLLVHLISPHADDLLYFHHQPNFKISYQTFHPGVPIVLEEMVNLVISRQRTPDTRSSHILAIDGLDLLWQALDPQSKLNLDWLIRNGPAVGFNIIATIDATFLPRNLTCTIDMFPARILGRVSQANLARFLSGFIRNQLSDLIPGQEFLLVTGGQALDLQILHSQDLDIRQELEQLVLTGGTR